MATPKVTVAPVGHRGRPVRMDARLAKHLEARGKVEYVTVEPVKEAEKPSRGRRATRKEKAPEAETEVVFTPSEKLDVEPEPDDEKPKRTYRRRDMQAED